MRRGIVAVTLGLDAVHAVILERMAARQPNRRQGDAGAPAVGAHHHPRDLADTTAGVDDGERQASQRPAVRGLDHEQTAAAGRRTGRREQRQQPVLSGRRERQERLDLRICGQRCQVGDIVRGGLAQSQGRRCDRSVGQMRDPSEDTERG
jgi:hypothetical protein